MSEKKDARISAVLSPEFGDKLKTKLKRLGGKRKLSMSMFLIACTEMDDKAFKEAVDDVLNHKTLYRSHSETIRIKPDSISSEALAKIDEILKQEAKKRLGE